MDRDDVKDAVKRGVAVGGTVATIAGAIKVKYDGENGEIESVKLGPVPAFWRDDKGRPRVLGIPFGRWFRGPRKG